MQTPEARKVVEFSPTQNANTFKFSVKKLKAECPELCVNSHKLKQEFEKIGFEVAFETPNWVLTHPALHIGSTRYRADNVDRNSWRCGSRKHCYHLKIIKPT